MKPDNDTFELNLIYFELTNEEGKTEFIEIDDFEIEKGRTVLQVLSTKDESFELKIHYDVESEKSMTTPLNLDRKPSKVESEPIKSPEQLNITPQTSSGRNPK